MSERTVHSKLAIASTIIPIVIWAYLGLLILIVIWRPFWRFVDWIFRDDSSSLGALGVVLILAIFLFGVIPIAGHLAGIIFGVIGIFAKNKKRVFAVIGSILNVLPFVAGLIIYATGYKFRF